MSSLDFDDEPTLTQGLTSFQKQLLKFQVEKFLGTLSAAELEQGIESVKSFGDKAKEFLVKYSGPLRGLIQAALIATGLGKIDIPLEIAEQAKQDESLYYHYQHLLEIAQRIGFESVYVLVDRVDETPATGDASTTFEFIWPLLADLRTLETRGGALKFFLWDQIGPMMTDRRFRSDRIDLDKLDWTLDELERMLQLRLTAYSGGRVSSFDGHALRVSSIRRTRAARALCQRLAPRHDQACQPQLVAEQTRTSAEQTRIETDAIRAGMREFAHKKTLEIFPESYLDDLRRIAKPTFTINHIANNVFRIHDNSARRKIQLWTDTGVITKVDEKPNPPNRPSYVYGIVDPRVALAILPHTDVALVLATQNIVCPHCNALCLPTRRRSPASSVLRDSRVTRRTSWTRSRPHDQLIQRTIDSARWRLAQ